MQEAPGVVKAIKSPTVHILRIRLGTRRQRLHERKGLSTETSEAPGGMPKAQTSQTEQRAPRHSPRPDLHAPVLDELPILVVQRTPDQGTGRLTFA